MTTKRIDSLRTQVKTLKAEYRIRYRAANAAAKALDKLEKELNAAEIKLQELLK